eukprot:gene1433-2052_t
MGAGRKTSSYGGYSDSGSSQVSQAGQRRNLQLDLGGVIFGCTRDTFKGLPRHHFAYVEYIVVGMPLFLFNYSDRTLHGIFKAVSEGELDINPSGWTTGGKGKTQYPAQVRCELYLQCPSLQEKQFKEIIKDNYYTYASHASVHLYAPASQLFTF